MPSISLFLSLVFVVNRVLTVFAVLVSFLHMFNSSAEEDP